MFIDKNEKELFLGVAERFRRDWEFTLQRLVANVTYGEDLAGPRLQLKLPEEVQRFLDDLRELEHALQTVQPREFIADTFAPLLREALIWERRSTANRLETQRERTVHPDLLKQVDAQVAPYDRAIAKDWFRKAAPIHVPVLRDYFPIAYIEQMSSHTQAEARILDEKFHILQAPSHFLGDLEQARSVGAVRGTSCAVAYLDIDNFKSVNTAHTEPMVDRNILPAFMRALEAHVHSRGFAYRFGGDEYILLFHNASNDETARSLERLRTTVENLQFRNTAPDFRITISIGFATITSKCHLTGREIESKTAEAKQAAKLSGKNRIATYSDPWFETTAIVGSSTA